MTMDVLAFFVAGLCALVLATAMAEADARVRLVERLGRGKGGPAARRAANDDAAGPADV